MKAGKSLLLCADHWKLYAYNYLGAVRFDVLEAKLCQCKVPTFLNLFNHAKKLQLKASVSWETEVKQNESHL